MLEGGECISYGARCLNEGGYHAIPKLTFPGGMLAGDSAGFLNVAKIKGTHNAIKTGMLAAENIYNQITSGKDVAGMEIKEYEEAVKNSWVYEEMKITRNFKGGFEKGLWFGLAHGRLVATTKGREPWTFAHTKKDFEYTKPKENYKPIEYPKKDGVLTFDLLTNLARTGTNHEHDQPSHLKVSPLIVVTSLCRSNLEWRMSLLMSPITNSGALKKGSAPQKYMSLLLMKKPTSQSCKLTLKTASIASAAQSKPLKTTSTGPSPKEEEALPSKSSGALTFKYSSGM